MGQYTELTASDGHVLRAFVEQPAQAATAAVVLLQEMDQRTPGLARAGTAATRPGVNRHIRTMAQAYAREGYLVVCPSTFGRGVSGRDYGYRFEPKGAWGLRIVRPLQPLASEAVMLDVRAAIDFAQRAAPSGRVAVVGYCWGGLLAWRAAARFADLHAVACFYGGGMESPQERGLQAKVPVQLHLPSGDAWMSAEGIQAIAQAQAALAGKPGLRPAQIHVYDAPYGFSHAGRPSHRPQADELAHQRCLAFLGQHLGRHMGRHRDQTREHAPQPVP